MGASAPHTMPRLRATNKPVAYVWLDTVLGSSAVISMSATPLRPGPRQSTQRAGLNLLFSVPPEDRELFRTTILGDQPHASYFLAKPDGNGKFFFTPS